MSEKSEAFHRLAVKRVENIADALRIFSNLAGPSYEWTPAEVTAYLGQIDTALAEARARFHETKRWRTALPPPEPPQAAEGEPEEDDTTESDEPAPEPRQRPSRPQSIAAIIQTNDDPEALAEIIAMQREVIEHLQDTLNQTRQP